MSVKMRIEVEKKIIRAFVRKALKAGYALSVSLERGYDVETMQENKALGSTSEKQIMHEAFTGDDCHIFVHDPKEPFIIDGQLNTLGWLKAIYGNSGYDVISDYSCCLEDEFHLLDEAMAISDKYSD